MSGLYSVPLDVFNRALQALRKPRVASTTDFTAEAQELAFSYDKVRLYELERNLWVFATRTCVVRPIGYSTMYIQPATWSSSTAYTVGSIVAYPSGTYWYCKSANTGNAPGNADEDPNGHLYWESYFGPLTAEQFVPTTGAASQLWTNMDTLNAPQDGTRGFSYQPGELAYIISGAGTAVVYQCLRATSDPPVQVDAWDANHHYNAGAVVSYSDGTWTPSSQSDGPPLGGPGTLGSPYYSLVNLNYNNDPTLTNREAPQPTWNIATQYVVSDYVIGSDGQIYLCLQNSKGDLNINVKATGYNPVTDVGNVYWQPLNMWAGAWSSTIPAGVSLNSSWQIVNVALKPIQIAWPIGCGPLTDTTTLNVYRLPAGWLRLAPDEPKTGIIPWLGGPRFVPAQDWVFQGEFLVSANVEPIKLRFVADFQDVSQMDPMFCEALALTLAIMTSDAPGIDVEDDVIARANGKYRTVVGDARQVNAIEVGPVLMPDDELVSVRY